MKQSSKVFMLLTLGLISCGFYLQNSSKEYISLFEKKIKADTNSLSIKRMRRCFIQTTDFKGKPISRSYFIFTNEGNSPVGTDIVFGTDNKILEIGTWQTKTDSFRLNSTDSIIIFRNPFKKVYCHVEYDQSKRSEPFTPGFVTGYAFQWTRSGIKYKETIKDKAGNIFVLEYDSLTGKIISKTKQ